MRRAVSVALCVIVMLAGMLTACSAAARPAQTLVRIAGSTSMTPLLQALAEAYTARHPGVRFDIQGGDSAAGLALLQSGEADLAAVSWKGEENGAPSPRLEWRAVAGDALAVIVHPSNSIEGLTLEQVGRLFAGWYTAWPEAGGSGGTIQVLTREEGSGSRQALAELAMGSQLFTQSALIVPSSQAVVEWVAAHPDAVGYVSSLWLTPAVKPLSIEGQPPASEAYPLQRRLYLVASPASGRPARDFVQFCLSPEGQDIVRRIGVAAK
jgi:phosphate transport system substrate-binding protein